jgi:hypothetical protein
VPRAGFEGGEANESSPIVEGNPAEIQAPSRHEAHAQGSSAEAAVTLSHDPIDLALAAARATWNRAADRASLRRVLLDVLQRLEIET